MNAESLFRIGIPAKIVKRASVVHLTRRFSSARFASFALHPARKEVNAIYQAIFLMPFLD
jgi:hypothetical protein